MARPKLKNDDKKGKLGITISKKIINKMESETNNKSKFIENLLINYFKIVNHEN